MTRTELIKEIIKLGEAMKDANGFECVMMLSDMEKIIEEYERQFYCRKCSNERLIKAMEAV